MSYQENVVPNLFIDSDVVIDLFTDREPHANSASELLGQAHLNLSLWFCHGF